MADLVSDLRHALGARPPTRTLVESIVGREGLVGLRRFYFPRWRPNRVLGVSPVLGARRIVVWDSFEANLVKAIAPAGVKVRVDIAKGDTRPSYNRSGVEA